MKKSEKDAHFAAQVPHVLRYHESMLKDGLRNGLLYKAIKNCVNPETRFLDIGAGTGVWAILAAKLGAKRVVAVEIEESLIPIIYEHARENGVADRIEIIHGRSNDVRIRERFDVIVCELFGSNALGRTTVESFIDLRRRFLAPGGMLIPQALETYLAPVHFEDPVADNPAKLPVSSKFIASLQRNYPRTISLNEREDIKFLAEPVKVFRLDFHTIAEHVSTIFKAEWNLRRISNANALAMFTRSHFAPTIEMSGFESQSWGTTLYEFESFQLGRGKLRAEMQIDDSTVLWTLSTPDNADAKPRTYSNAFPPAQLKMKQQVTPFKRAKPKKGIDKK